MIRENPRKTTKQEGITTTNVCCAAYQISSLLISVYDVRFHTTLKLASTQSIYQVVNKSRKLSFLICIVVQPRLPERKEVSYLQVYNIGAPNVIRRLGKRSYYSNIYKSQNGNGGDVRPAEIRHYIVH